MLKLTVIIFISLAFFLTEGKGQKKPFGSELKSLTDSQVIPVPAVEGKLIHRGVFSPDLNEFYFTISDYDYTHFDILCTRKVDGTWSMPRQSFFNSDYDDHGMSFSPDGKFLYFSSTRPVNKEGMAETWHIWRCEYSDGHWSTPEYVDIPDMENKLLSHPTITASGEMYFQASNSDYSEIDIYCSVMVNGRFQKALKLELPGDNGLRKCTPYVAPDGSYMLFATVGHQLDLQICLKSEKDEWEKARTLDKRINTHGQGNPNVTPDGTFLIYTVGTHTGEQPAWRLKYTPMDSVINITK